MEWPGWCRSGRDEALALQNLLSYGPRYARVVLPARLGFLAPTAPEQLRVTERLQGSATTDFGAPDASPRGDAQWLDEPGLDRATALLRSCWSAFDAAASAARGKELTLGPRGGGRSLQGIVEHVREAELAYLKMLGARYEGDRHGDAAAELSAMRTAILDALRASLGAGPPRRGPRGGVRWTSRYFVRRTCWHVLDHAWEMEDRSV